MVSKLLEPVVQALPLKSVLGNATPYIAAILTMALICFAAGILARTGIATKFSETVERLILHRIPGYTLFKGAMAGFEGIQARSNVSVVLVDTGQEKLQLGFVLEHNPDGLLTVFVPSAPTPTSGSVYFLKPEKVRKIDISVTAAVKCLMQLGVGSQKFLSSPVPQSDGETREGTLA
ncbi:MAG: DUF502 domain-containing protein [Deltaproteobacteria bacterium]|nr:DUF502 domain-containing protein [Deltaproteobacteria bacterium]